ncbi:MAG: OB-fold nucleic acid binding domain-containing protein [Candidatus Bathyarchaeota archaeon]|nr:OB-fold nucleic acid binding domain-containing protein [Candidatus Bathyarchaeota archaeon]
MRMKVSRQRGRPRGRYHALADFRLLEYLAMISGKYGIDSNDFFNSFVEAWKRQQSTCKGLLIECRKRTRDNAVFLITNSSKVVAQFPIPKHILEETNPLKEFAYAKASRRTIVERTKVKPLQIRDLKSGMNQINLEAKVLEIPKPIPVVTRFGEFAKVANASIKDETGIIQLPLWNKQIDTVSVGDIVQVENARVVTFRGERQLRVGRGGQLSVLEKR